MTSRVSRSDVTFDLGRLVSEVEIIREIESFGRGTFEHSISLPSESDVDEEFRTHRNNLPFSDVLSHCPYIKEIFEYFHAPKAAFRLLRRLPGSAYSLHDDKDLGTQVCRMQIPIITNELAFLTIPTDSFDREAFNCFASDYIERAKGDVWFELSELTQRFGRNFEHFRLEPGYLYFFDTSRLHTLINAGPRERITLALDLVVNSWLTNWMAVHMQQRVEPVATDELEGARWEWDSLRFGIIAH